MTISSCKKEQQKNTHINSETELKTESINSENELSKSENKKSLKTIEYNTNNSEILTVERPEKTIIQNLEIDTTNAFGIWALDPNSLHADFWLTSKSFYVVDNDGDGEMPYILDKNEITVFFKNFTRKGIINATSKDTLKIKWKDLENETIYVKYPK